MECFIAVIMKVLQLADRTHDRTNDVNDCLHVESGYTILGKKKFRLSGGDRSFPGGQNTARSG